MLPPSPSPACWRRLDTAGAACRSLNRTVIPFYSDLYLATLMHHQQIRTDVSLMQEVFGESTRGERELTNHGRPARRPEDAHNPGTSLRPPPVRLLSPRSDQRSGVQFLSTLYLTMVDWKGVIRFRGLIIGRPGPETTLGPSDLIQKSIAF